MDEPSSKTLQNWALFRFSVVGGLLAKSPEKGKLQQEIMLLAERVWNHPVTNESVKFSFSTIERWHYRAIATTDPIRAMARKQRMDAGKTTALTPAQLMELKQQYKLYPHWSYQLHLDNLTALVKTRPYPGSMPSYATLRRRMLATAFDHDRQPVSRPLRECCWQPKNWNSGRCEVMKQDTFISFGIWIFITAGGGFRIPPANVIPQKRCAFWMIAPGFVAIFSGIWKRPRSA